MASEDVSVKSTKNEILEAYHQAVAKLREKENEDRRGSKERAEKEAVVKSAVSQTLENIVRNLSQVKLEVGREFDQIENKLLSEHRRLTDLEQAILFEKKQLADIYEISANSQSLTALLLAQKEKKEGFDSETKKSREAFEREIEEKRISWDKDQLEHDFALKERDTQREKARKREEEEYLYNRELTRKKEQNDHDSKKTLLEKELAEKKIAAEKDLAERQKVVVDKEQEFLLLKKQVEEFPKKLELELAHREKTVLERIETKYKFAADLSSREIEGERKLYQQKISALEEKIKTQFEQIRELSGKANDASIQVQAIAVKAIEGASASAYQQQRFNERLVATRHEPKAN